jgi:peptidoglycan-associated lipoprotein
MNILSKRLAFVLIGAAILLTGCPKKPQRPDPSATLLGPGTGGQINPLGLGDMGDTSLEQRTGSADRFAEENLQRGLLPIVYFDFDKSAIRQSERSKLQEAAAWLSANPDKTILLEGHCDWRGTAEYNLGLGDRRSQAVREYLQSIGVDASRLETLSKGDLSAQENATADQMSQERRVELVVFK